MTTLKANAAASVALHWKKVEALAKAVRGRVEACPEANLFARLGVAEQYVALRNPKAEGALDDIDAALQSHKDRIAEADMAAAGQAQDQLLAERGVETYAEGTVRTRDGWRWLRSRQGRLTSVQIETGDRYSSLYSLAHRDGLSSSCNDNAGAGTEDPIEARLKARSKLSEIRRHIEGATGSEKLVDLLAMVCGRGETLRTLAGNDDRKASALEVELRLALDMAGVAFKGKREEAA